MDYHRLFSIKRISESLCSFVFLTIFFTGYANANTYKCLDEQGRVFYQQNPCDTVDAQPYRVDGFTKPTPADKQQAPQSTEVRQIPTAQNMNALGSNLLRNPDFEQQLSHWYTVSDANWLPDRGENGSGVLLIQARKPPEDKYIHETVVAQCVPIGEGVEFTLGGSFRHEGSPIKDYANRLRVYWFESPDCTTGGQYGTYVEPKRVSGWQTIAQQKIKPTLHAKSARVEIMQNGRFSNGGKGYWDNVHLVVTNISNQQAPSAGYRLPADFDFIENGGFNKDLSAWRSWYSSWTGTEGHRYPGALKVTLTSTGGGMGTGVSQQCVNYGANKHFEAGASFRHSESNLQSGTGRFRITWYELTDCHGRNKAGLSSQPDNSEGWQRLKITNLVAPDGTNSALIELIQAIDGNGAYTAYWDDVYFKSVKETENRPR